MPQTYLNRNMQMILDRNAGEIGLVAPSKIPAMIPYIDATDSVLLAFWVTADGEQLQTISLDTISGEVALTRVGTKEPMLAEGTCTAQE